MNDKIAFLEIKCDKLLSEHKQSEDIGSFTAAILLLGGLVLITIVLLYIRDGFTTRMIVFLSTLLVMFVVYKFRIKAEGEQIITKKPLLESSENSVRTKAKIEYLSAGLNLKLTRVNATKWFYAVVFPLFLYSVKHFIHSDVTNDFVFKSGVLVFPLSFIVWSVFFSGDKRKLKDDLGQVGRMKGEL